MTKALLAVLAGAAIVAAGCSTTAGTEELGSSSDQGKATAGSTDTNTLTAAMAKCQLCGMEVPSAELVMHDGKMACKACIDSHGH